MIFQTENIKIDLSLYGVSLTEESNLFVDNMLKSYSLPATLTLTPELSLALGLPDIGNIDSVSAVLKGTLNLHNTYYTAVMYLGERVGNELDFNLYFGDEVLPVYASHLRELPWPIHIIESVQQLYTDTVDTSWPTATHNFPKVFRPDIAGKSDYKDFLFFANNTNGSNFIENTQAIVQGQTVYQNRNVLMPCPYILEILRFGFATEGKQLAGGILEDERLHNLVFLPKKFRERFSASTFTAFSLNTPTSTTTEIIDGVSQRRGFALERLDVGVYTRQLSPENIGTYNLSYAINLDPVVGQYFALDIYQENPITFAKTFLTRQRSINNRVNLEDRLSIEITDANQFHNIYIVLQLLYTTEDISEFNSFEFSYNSGRLNEFVGSYSLSDYMPDMTFGNFVNLIKNWLNLEIYMVEDYVYMNFVEQHIQTLPKVNMAHLEELYPKITRNNKRTFRLNYNDDTYALADSSGRIFSDLEKNPQDIIKIDMGVSMAVVESNYSQSTAVYNEDIDIQFALYTGVSNTGNNTVTEVEGFTGKIDNVVDLFWTVWLSIRTNNLTIKDSFLAHKSENISLRSLWYKYNQLLLPKVIRKKRSLQNHWEYEIEAETI